LEKFGQMTDFTGLFFIAAVVWKLVVPSAG